MYQLADPKIRQLNQALGAGVSAPLSLLGLSGNAGLDREN
jgi:hypothetical protein